MMGISPKVTVGAGASGASVGPALLIIWLLGLFHIPVPPEVAAVIATEFAAAVGLLAGYLTPHTAPDVTVQIDDLRVQMATILARLPSPSDRTSGTPS